LLGGKTDQSASHANGWSSPSPSILKVDDNAKTISAPPAV